MSLVIADRIKETSTTTGTGDITLDGAVTRYLTFAARCADGSLVDYVIEHQSIDEWELGRGTVSAGVLTRSTGPDRKSSNGDDAVDFSAGVKHVWLNVPADVLGAIPSELVYAEVSLSVPTTGTAEQVLATFTIPAGTFESPRYSGFHLEAGLLGAVNGNQKRVRLRQDSLVGTLLLDTGALATSGLAFNPILRLSVGGAGILNGYGISFVGAGGGSFSHALRTSGHDFSQAVTFVVTAETANQAGDVVLVWRRLELLRARP